MIPPEIIDILTLYKSGKIDFRQLCTKIDTEIEPVSLIRFTNEEAEFRYNHTFKIYNHEKEI